MDDYSRFTWLMFLAHKNDAPQAFMKLAPKIQTRRATTSHPYKPIMRESSKIKVSHNSVIGMALNIIPPLSALHNKVEL